MDLTIILDYIIISIIASMTVNSVLRNYAKKYNILVDLPDRSRKFHKRPTPVTGGLGILIALLISGKLYIDLNQQRKLVAQIDQGEDQEIEAELSQKKRRKRQKQKQVSIH